jgi:hypothetical protein
MASMRENAFSVLSLGFLNNAFPKGIEKLAGLGRKP